jgi:hypothetical protein
MRSLNAKNEWIKNLLIGTIAILYVSNSKSIHHSLHFLISFIYIYYSSLGFKVIRWKQIIEMFYFFFSCFFLFWKYDLYINESGFHPQRLGRIKFCFYKIKQITYFRQRERRFISRWFFQILLNFSFARYC